MKRGGRVGILAVLAAAILADGAVGLGSVTPVRVAAINPRCNHNVAERLENHVRADDRHAPRSSLNDLNQRQQELDAILQEAQLEHDILHNMCTVAERPAVQDQLAGVIAWAYALEADIAPERYELLHCPQTASTAPAGLLALGWYALASTFNSPDRLPGEATPTPAPLVKEVMPKVQARASAAGLTLPALADSTQYWRDMETAKVAVCVPPSP
ncbi:MAG TPA: hypothetical protein VMV82_08380 [Candidatus Dormibacteraeota bacterium]|nr:hypothetical protein [Candidatus Dormibacteraeota bacterium]